MELYMAVCLENGTTTFSFENTDANDFDALLHQQILLSAGDFNTL
jgi:hypothetical protein